MIVNPLLAIPIPGLQGLGTPELIIILVIVLVLFGPKRLPQLGKSLGKTMKAIRDGASGKSADTADQGTSSKESAASDKKADASDDEEAE